MQISPVGSPSLILTPTPMEVTFGWRSQVALPDWLAARDWLGRVVAPRLTPPGPPAGALKLLTVCSGALLAADAGLLAGRQATTHHELLDGLRRLAPACSLLP